MSINLRKIDLNLLVIFEALYSTGSTSRTAERLGMSQPAVSNALARLRDLIGDPLFVREARGLRPTGKSHEIIGPVRDALTVIGRQFVAADTIDLATYKRLFRIIMADPYEPILLPPIIRTIAAHAPGIEIECVPATAQYVDDIRDGSIDLACFAFPTDTTDIVAKALCPVDYVVVSRRDHPEIRKPLDVETLRRLPQISVGRELRGLTGIDKNADGRAHRPDRLPAAPVRERDRRELRTRRPRSPVRHARAIRVSVVAREQRARPRSQMAARADAAGARHQDRRSMTHG